MTPQNFQPFIDKVIAFLSAPTLFLNYKTGAFDGSFVQFIISPTITGVCSLILTLTLITLALMRIYDQFITTKAKKKENSKQSDEC